MFSLTHNGNTLFDPRLDGYPLQSPVLSLEANKFGTLDFTIYPGHPEYGNIEKLTSQISLYQDDVFSGLYRPTYSKQLFKGGILYRCQEITYRLNDFYYRPLTYTGTVDGFIAAVLASYNARVDASEQFAKGTVSGGTAAFSYSESKPLGHWDALQKLVADKGGYIAPSYTGGTLALNYYQESDLPVATQSITFGQNITDLFIETDADNTFSVLYPLGKNGTDTITISSVNSGVDYLESAAAIAIYGRRETCITWENVESASELKTLAQAKLNEIAITFADAVQISALDLHNADLAVAAFKFLSRVDCESAPHGFSHRYVLSRMKVPLGSPAASVYQLGEKRQTLSNNITLEKKQTQAQIESVKTSIAAETERAINAEITSIVKEYALGTSALIAPTSGWSETFPEPNSSQTYVWSRIVTVDGTGTHYSTPTVEAGYRTISQAAITAANIANGSTAVPRVSSTGVDINGDTLQISSTGKIQMLGNSEVFFGTSSSNSGVKMNQDGIAIGSQKAIAIASGGKLQIISGTFDLQSGDLAIETTNNGGGYMVIANTANGTGISIFGQDAYGRNVYSVMRSTLIAAMEVQAVERLLIDGTNVASIKNGWIKDASVSGNTLTLTKSDGSDVTFTPS